MSPLRAGLCSVPYSPRSAVAPIWPKTILNRKGYNNRQPSMYLRWALTLGLLSAACYPATFGTVVPVIGGASDIVLDEARGRLYLVNTNQNRVEVYSIQQRRLLTPVKTDVNPLAAALSRSGNALYVTSRDASALDIIDL